LTSVNGRFALPVGTTQIPEAAPLTCITCDPDGDGTGNG
jgi:hypothetical protein